MTGVTPRNDEELAQFEVECREGKPPRVRVLFCPWNVHLHLAVQTCVRQRKPRLLGMATFSDVCRLEGGGQLDTTLRPSILHLGSGTHSSRSNSTVTVGVYRGNPADNLWLIRGYRRALPSVKSAPDVLAPLIHHPRQNYSAKMSNTIALYAPFLPS